MLGALIVVANFGVIAALGEFPLTHMYLYYISDAVLVLAILILLIGGMKASQQDRKPLLRLCMAASGVLFTVVLIDLYIVNFRLDTVGPSGNFIPHAHWTNTVPIPNRDGFWERDLTPFKEAKSHRLVVAAAGNSFTWGQGLTRADDRFTNGLEKLLKNAGLDAAVLNFAGFGGVTTGVGDRANLVRGQISQVHPDIVLFAYTAADIPMANFMRAERPDIGLLRYMTFNPTVNFIAWKRYMPQIYGNFATAVNVNRILAYDDNALLSQNLEKVRAMAAAARDIGAAPIFVILPYPHFWVNVYPEVRDRILTVLRDRLNGLGLPVIDLSGLDKEFSLTEYEVNSMDSHPNSQAHARIAKKLFEALSPLLPNAAAVARTP